ncbi:MAG: hypothetical protein JNL64_01835 [Blastocatellia bacterium]|nr:hypothetical protein [Blastocatellia bacterium]
MKRFLLGKESIKSIDDLGPHWASTIASLLSRGAGIDKEYCYNAINESRLADLFRKDRSDYFTERTAIADTALALATYKQLGRKENIDYLSILRVMTLVERCFNYKMDLPEKSILSHFTCPVVLPECFTKLDEYNPPNENKVFSFLDDKPASDSFQSSGGCTSTDCVCVVDDKCIPQSKCCAKPRMDIIDLLVVKEETTRYQAGDLSYIKNVMEGEELSTEHRRLERTEELIETEEEIRQFEERYLQTEEKASVQKETENVVKNDSSLTAGVTANYTHGKEATGKFNITGNTSFTSSKSKAQTNKEVLNSSKDIVDRAIKQVEEKVRKLTSTRRVFETEETNRHTFDNKGKHNMSGQYLFVNKVSRAQVYNYGRKAVIELVLPEPASLYKALLGKRFQAKEPTLAIKGPKGVTRENYIDLVNTYNIDKYDVIPDEKLEFAVGPIQLEYTDDGKEYVEVWNFTIPEMYRAVSMHFNFHYGNRSNDEYASFVFGDGTNEIYFASDTSKESATLPGLVGEQTAFRSKSNNFRNVHTKILVQCELMPEALYKWQLSIFSKITEDHEKALSLFRKEKQEFEAKEEEQKRKRNNQNPFINREIERTELKRMAISYISCQFFDQFSSMKNMVEPCGYPEMNLREVEEEGKFIQFFEQAFSWNLMTYIFYPYFWGKKCTWGDKLNDEATDLIFKKFLEAGSCRVLVPIRDGFDDYVSYFLTYGEIWGGQGDPPLSSDPHYVSLAQELKEQKQNYYADRDGELDTTPNAFGAKSVILNDSDHYWDFNASPDALNQANIDADIDREIIIDCKVYRITNIQENTSVAQHRSWIISLDRDYAGIIGTDLKWSTGAVYVGAPWEYVTPTTLVFLRDESKCLPNYPLEECKENT